MAAKSSPLAGLTIAVTGKLQHFSRAEAKSAVRDQGGRYAENVSGQTDYLVAGERSGSKVERAIRRGVKVLRESEFRDLLKGDLEIVPDPTSKVDDASVILEDLIVTNGNGYKRCRKCDAVELACFRAKNGTKSLWICEASHNTSARQKLYKRGYEKIDQTYSGNMHRVAFGCERDELNTTMLEEEVTCVACLAKDDRAIHLANSQFEPSCDLSTTKRVRLTLDESLLTCPNCRRVVG